MKYLALILTLYSSVSFCASDLPGVGLKEFATDGCTMFVDGTKNKPNLWHHCCVEHDMSYWFGGSSKDMDKADLNLKSCVNEVAGPVWARLIYTGVRAGHHSPVKNKTHWSWGWIKTRSNTSLSTEEIDYVIEELRRLPFDQVIIETFIKKNFEIKNVKI